MLRAIYLFHRHGPRLARHRLQLRGRPLRAHVRGARRGHRRGRSSAPRPAATTPCSTGVAVLGSFTTPPISPAARSGARRSCWRGSSRCTASRPAGSVAVRVDPGRRRLQPLPGAAAQVSLPRIAGHRDADSTDCPGDALYGELPAIRARAHALVGHARAGHHHDPRRENCFGTLTLLDGTPLAGQPLTLQARSVSRRGEVVVREPRGPGGDQRRRAMGAARWAPSPPPAGVAAGPVRRRRLLRRPRSPKRSRARLGGAVPRGSRRPSERLRGCRPARPVPGAFRSASGPLAQQRALARGQAPAGARSTPAAWGSSRAAAQRVAGLVEAVVHPRQRAAPREALDRLELPVRARVPGLARSKRTIRQPGGQAEQPRQVFVGPLLPAAGPHELVQLARAQAGVRPPWPKGNGPCRRPRAGSPAACRPCRPSPGTPNSEMTPSMSTIKSGRTPLLSAPRRSRASRQKPLKFGPVSRSFRLHRGCVGYPTARS